MNDAAAESLARIFPDVEPAALVGSHPRGREPNGEPEPPTPQVSVPDMALQMSPCLGTLEQLLHIDIADELVAALRSRFGSDIRRRCVTVAGTNRQVETIGVWSRPSGSAEADAARNRGLSAVSILQGGHPLAFFFSKTLLRAKLQQAFNDMPGHRFDTHGHPDPDGPIHLTGISLQLVPPRTVKTFIDGFDERPFPDIDFRITVTDELSTSGGHLVCDTTHKIDTDTRLLNFLAVITAPLLVFLIEGIVVAINTEAPGTTAADCWVDALAEEEILITGGQKVLLSYGDVEVTSAGLILTAPAGGLPVVDDRVPSIDIIGPRRVVDNLGTGTARASYGAQPNDMRNRIRVRWSLDGTTLSADAKPADAQRITFFPTPGATMSKRVRVSATDADGLTAEDELTVTVSSRVPPGGNLP